MQKQKLQKQVSFETRLFQSLVIGLELMLLYALIIIDFNIPQKFEDAQTRGFCLMVLPLLSTITVHAFRVARREQHPAN